MFNHMIQIFGGAKLVYNCVCGYSGEEQSTGMYWSDTSGANSAGNVWDSVSHLPCSGFPDRPMAGTDTPTDDEKETNLREWGEALRKYLKTGAKSARLEELVSSGRKNQERYRQLLDPSVAAGMAVQNASLPDIVKEAAYLGHLNMLYEIYGQEELAKRENQEFDQMTGEYPGLAKVAGILAQHRRLPLEELKEIAGTESTDLEHILSGCGAYFNIRENLQVSLSPKGRRYHAATKQKEDLI